MNERSALVLFRPSLLRTFDEELLRVYGEDHLHRMARVMFFDDANRLAYALGVQFHLEREGFTGYLERIP